MGKGNTRIIWSPASLQNFCLHKVIENLDHYSPQMLSILPPLQRKKLLLLYPVVSICHLEQTCAFNDIDSDTFWDELINRKHGGHYHYDLNALEALKISYSSNREKFFTFLTATIFSGDRFSGIYGWFTRGRHFYEGGTPPPEEQDCPDDIVNYLIACQTPHVRERIEVAADHEDPDSDEEYSDDNDFYYPLPSRDAFGRSYGKLYEGVGKCLNVHSRFSHYISKENHYCLSDEDAVSLMMNECHFYPKKLFLHEYEHMHWKWSHSDLTQLLMQFFSKLESLSLHFRQGKDIDDYVSTDNTKEGMELVLSCCFSSPVLSSLEILDPVNDDTASKMLSSTLATKPCPSLKKLDIYFWVLYIRDVHCLEALAKIIASHSQLTEICVRLDTSAKVDASSFSCFYTSLISFVQRQEFSKLTLEGLVPISLQLKRLLDAFFKTPCSQPQEIHLRSIEPVHNEATPLHVPVGDSKIPGMPSGALEYKSLFLHQYSRITADFCEWLFSHEPLVLKAFHYDASIIDFGEFGRLVPSKTVFPVHLLSDNSLFQTRELSLPIFSDFPNVALHNLFHRQQLTHLSLKSHEQGAQESIDINAITEILLYQKEQLTELTISRENSGYVSIKPSADMERFGNALFSLRKFEIFSLHIAIMWKKDDISYIDRLYNSWLKHGRKKMKLFQMGKFEYQFSLTDELAAKLDKMGLVIDLNLGFKSLFPELKLAVV